MSNVLMAAMNTSNPYLGLFGLGIQQGRFGDIVADSPITQAVKSFGWAPSYSYGYTAGAHYRNTVVSATLGGYDSARFVPHDTAFTLEQGESIPHTLVRGIQIAANNSRDRPERWSSPVDILSDWNSSFTAMIDSSTPYLWLPEPVCARFAEALNLTYNSTFELYTLSDDLYRRYTTNSSLAFTFSLSSFDNRDNFGLPLEVPGLVNITVPVRAFVSTLSYPAGRGAIQYGDPAVPYFSLRKSVNNTFVIGRSFLQESYLITKFDESLYSIHQAVFPRNADRDATLVPIRQPSNSPYPPPPRPHRNDPLSAGQMAGIAVGAVLLCTVIVGGGLYLRRSRRRSRKSKGSCKGKSNKSSDDALDQNDTASTLAPDSPCSPKASVSRIFSKIGCHHKHSQSRRSPVETSNPNKNLDGGVFDRNPPIPAEAPDCQIYELSASAAPIELEAGSDRGSVGEIELTSQDPQEMTAYEVARRKMERQLRGPVPAYSPPAGDSVLVLGPEKATRTPRQLDTSHVTLQQPSPASPTRSAGGGSHANSFPTPELSPVSPRADWHTYSTILPSPVVGSLPQRFSGVTNSWSITDRHAETYTTDLVTVPEASLQRNTTDYSNVICLGPLPEDLQRSQRDTLISRLTATEGRGVPSTLFNRASRASEGSLGSNYTEEEDMIAGELTRQATLPQADPARWHPVSMNRSPVSSAGSESQSSASKSTGTGPSSTGQDDGRLDPLRDLVHVPQPAVKRYSWEDQ